MESHQNPVIMSELSISDMVYQNALREEEQN